MRPFGLSLNDFQVDVDIDQRGNPYSWPLLTAVADRASPNVCFLNYAGRKQSLNINIIYDINHGAWDDEKNTIKDCGLLPFLLLWLIVSNVFEGRWGTHDRYQQSMEALTDLMRTTNPEEVLAFLEVIIIIMIIIIMSIIIMIITTLMINNNNNKQK